MSSDLRIGGLASGMDIDSIVTDLMKAERIPLDKMTQQKQTLEWQRDDYREMNTLLLELDTFIFDGVMRQATFTQKTVTSSNENEVSVNNINSTSNINATINVSRLAENAYMVGQNDIRANTNFDPAGKLADERANLATDFTSNTFIIQAVQNDGTLGEEISFTIDPAEDSLNDIISDINNSGAGVTAFFDEQTGKVSLTANNTGNVVSGAEIIVTGDFLTGSLQLDGDSDTAAANSRGRVGVDAQFTLNGLTTTRASNTFNVNGYEYTLKAASGTDVRVSSTTDTDRIFEDVKSFVDKYNEIIEKINDKISEERYRDYKPLTDEQKEVMSDKEVELWEERAKSGLLQRDSLLSSGLSQMRMDLYSKVDGTGSTDYDQLTEIGIKTSSNYRENGKLIIDEKKLKEAIQADPDAVYKLFTSDGSTFETKGLARRLRDTIDTTMDNIAAKAGKSLSTLQSYSIGKQLSNLSTEMDQFQDRLNQIEDRYWRQFTAMEKAIQQANQQSAYLMQQFSL